MKPGLETGIDDLQAAPSLRDTLLPPQWNMLGGLPVVLGLWLVSQDSARLKIAEKVEKKQ